MAKFKSKFNIGDTVYLMENNTIKKDTIRAINFSVWKHASKINQTSAHYGLVKNGLHQGIAEPLLHASIDDLLVSLKHKSILTIINGDS